MTTSSLRLLVVLLFAGALASAQVPKPHQYIRVGSAQDVQRKTTPGAALMGGGTDLDEGS